MAGAEDCCFAASIPAFRGRGAPANEDSPKSIFRIFLVRAQDLIGRGVTSKIYAKEAILDSRLALKGAGGRLPAMIPPGMRAVGVPVNEVIGDAGFVVPGMHVDVLISGTPPSGTGGLGTLTTTLLQNIEVLSAGQDFKEDAEGKPVAVQPLPKRSRQPPKSGKPT